MWPILFSSIVALAIFFQKIFALRRTKVLPKNFLIEIEDLMTRKKYPEVITLCKQNDCSAAQIILAALLQSASKGALDKDKIMREVEEAGKRESAQLEKYTSALATIASIAPLLGLLGTVSGIMKVFDVISTHGVGNANILAGGIAEALITTIAGLVVAIPVLVAYRFLLARARSLVMDLEHLALRLIHNIQESA